jgi:intracellular sulfur oxidation DsrE/DsrF family protein
MARVNSVGYPGKSRVPWSGSDARLYASHDPEATMTDRRAFLGSVAGFGAAAFLSPELARGDGAVSDPWLDRLKGKHRQLFDAPEPDGGTVLRHARGYLDVWHDAYGVAERDVNLIVTLYGRTTPFGVQDAMWVKYKLGAALNLTDTRTNAPLVRNYFAHPQPEDPVGDGTPECSIESLQRRGVLFLLCNNALQRWSARLEKDGLGAAQDIHDDLVAHALPGVVVVPNVLIAMTKAHERGFAYARS